MDTIGIICGNNTTSKTLRYLLGIGVGVNRDINKRDDIDEESKKYEWMTEYAKAIDFAKSRPDEMMKGDACDANKYNIYFASFSDSLIYIVSLLTSVPWEYFDNDKKHKYIININTYDYREKTPEDTVVSPEYIFNDRWRDAQYRAVHNKHTEISNEWMTLNDFVVYFGFYICRNFLGKNIWTKVEETSNKRFPPEPNSIRIYDDIRSLGEYEYIKKCGGKIVRVETKDNNKGGVIYDSALNTVDVTLSVSETDIYNLELLYEFIKRHF